MPSRASRVQIVQRQPHHLHARARRAFQQAPTLQSADRLPQRTAAHAQLHGKRLFAQLVPGLVPAAQDELFQPFHDMVCQDPGVVVQNRLC